MPRTCPGGGARTCPGGGARSARASAPRAHPLTPTSRSLTGAPSARPRPHRVFSHSWIRKTDRSVAKVLPGFPPKIAPNGTALGENLRSQAVASNWSHSRTCRHEGSRFTRVERAFGKNSKMLSSPTAILAITAPRSCASSMLSKLEGSSWHPSVDGAAAFVSFTEEMYEAMLHDDARTSAFGLAISRRVRAHAGGCVVLDLGTGPFAVLALFAARAGASKVFAVEANPEAAAKARALIASSAASDIPPGTIEVIEGFSTTITLPEQADLLISEIAGSLASEEGMLATIRDARLRHMKRPWDPRSYIPARVQTLAVPAAYSLHHRLNCNWIASGPPVRFACDSPWLLPLATPQLWEDFAFGGEELPPGLGARCTTVLEFRVCASTLKGNAARLVEQLDLHDVDADRAGVPKQLRTRPLATLRHALRSAYPGQLAERL